MLNKLHTHLVQSGPALLRLPLQFIPFGLKKQIIEQLLRWQFNQALIEGELDFLSQRWLKITITDLGLTWFITLENNKLKVSRYQQEDVTFSGKANDLVLIAARKEDPDTLFFQRRLLIEGDTELGLHIKNLIDSIELESMPTPLRIGLMQLANFIESGQKNDNNVTKLDTITSR